MRLRLPGLRSLLRLPPRRAALFEIWRIRIVEVVLTDCRRYQHQPKSRRARLRDYRGLQMRGPVRPENFAECGKGPGKSSAGLFNCSCTVHQRRRNPELLCMHILCLRRPWFVAPAINPGVPLSLLQTC
jgi:hypothetical protein